MANKKNTQNNSVRQDVIDQMLAEVTADVAEFLNRDVSSLRKAAEDGVEPTDEESEGSSGPAAPAEASAPDDGAPDAGPPGPPDGMAPEAPPMDPSMGAGPDAGMDQGAIEPAPTVEELQGEYMKLDPEALKMHYMACKQAIMAAMGADAGGGMPPDAGAAPAAPPMAPEASAPPAMKAEVPAGKVITESDGNGGETKKGSALGKSEAEIENAALKQQLKKNEEDFATLALKLIGPSLRKSVKGISEIAFVPKEGDIAGKSKTEGLSKNEIVQKLREKSRNESLKKSDRDLINKYTCGVSGVTVADIEYLLVD